MEIQNISNCTHVETEENPLLCFCDIPESYKIIKELQHIKCQALKVGQRQLNRLRDDNISWNIQVQRNKVSRFFGIRLNTIYWILLAIILLYIAFRLGISRGIQIGWCRKCENSLLHYPNKISTSETIFVY